MFTVATEIPAGSRTMTVTARKDAEREWTFEEPGWRSLGYGFAPGAFYFWSARRLIQFPLDSESNPTLLSVNEDLLSVFSVSAAWLLVCETSVRLVRGGHELSRVEFGEVILEAWLSDSDLVARDANGVETRIALNGDDSRLRVRPMGEPKGDGGDRGNRA